MTGCSKTGAEQDEEHRSEQVAEHETRLETIRGAENQTRRGKLRAPEKVTNREGDRADEREAEEEEEMKEEADKYASTILDIPMNKNESSVRGRGRDEDCRNSRGLLGHE